MKVRFGYGDYTFTVLLKLHGFPVEKDLFVLTQFHIIVLFYNALRHPKPLTVHFIIFIKINVIMSRWLFSVGEDTAGLQILGSNNPTTRLSFLSPTLLLFDH